MKILLIAGSARTGSHTRAMLEVAKSAAEGMGHDVQLWDLAEDRLPVSEAHWHGQSPEDPDHAVNRLATAINGADALVLGTPLYNGSYSGVLKNALDCLSYDAFRGKKVGLVSNGGNMRKCLQPCLHLVAVVQTLFGQPTQTQIGSHDGDYQETDSGYELVEPGVADRIPRLIEELAS